MNDWNSCALIGEMIDDILHLMVQEAEGTNPLFLNQGIQTKFPGGKSRGHADATPLVTLHREIKEELFLRIRPGVNPREILRVLAQYGHVKFFYFLWRHELEGDIRTILIEERNSLIYPPRMVPIHELLKEGVLYKTHVPALWALQEELSLVG